ncbi:MAG: hypothetical protein K9N00_06390 [Candidatus Marinimicrobia bacterium]|nr:hypothetical protein [Candidatus Neomarinimicrobiota bacterium]
MTKIENNEFLIAISYSGKTDEQLKYVKELYEELCLHFKNEYIFFDREPIHEIRLKGDNKFQSIYKKSIIMLAIVSNSYYNERENTGIEILELNDRISRDENSYLIIENEKLELNRAELNNKITYRCDVKDDFSKIIESLKYKLDKITNLNDYLRDGLTLNLRDKINNFSIDKSNNRNNYKMLYQEVQQLENRDPEIHTKSRFFIKRVNLVEELDDILNQYGIALIHGPQGIGKTTFINNYVKNKNYDIIQNFNSDVKHRYSNLMELYTDWTKNLISEIIEKFNVKKSTLINNPNYEYIAIFSESSEDLLGALTAKYKYYCTHSKHKSRFEAIQRIIDEIIEDLRKVKTEENIENSNKFIIEITIDNFERLLNNSLIKEFHDDCNNFFESYEGSKNYYKGKIKFIFSSRFFPINRPPQITVNISRFSEKEIKKIFSPIVELEKIDPPHVFYNIISKITHGYQWFVIRLLKIYLILRIYPDFDNYSIIDMAKKRDFWTNENLFRKKQNVNSKFINTIIDIAESNLREDDRDDFIKIISRIVAADKELNKTVKAEINRYINNLVLMESGLMDYSYNYKGMKKDKINGYSNPLIKEHFIEEIHQYFN